MQEQETTKTLKEWVIAFKAANNEGRKKIINELIQIQPNNKIKINDKQLLSIYMNLSQKYYWLLKDDLDCSFVSFVIEAFHEINLQNIKTGKEFRNSQIIQYFKVFIENKVIDLTKSWDFHNKMQPIDQKRNKKGKSADDETFEIHITDKKTMSEYNALDTDSPAKAFIKNVSLEDILDDQLLQLYKIRTQADDITGEVPDTDSVRKLAEVLNVGKSTVHRRNQKLENILNQEFEKWFNEKGKYIVSSNLSYIIKDFLNKNDTYDFEKVFEFISKFYFLKNEEYEEHEEFSFWEKLQSNKPDYTYTMLTLLEEYIDDREIFLKLWRCLKYKNISWISENDKNRIVESVIQVFKKYLRLEEKNKITEFLYKKYIITYKVGHTQVYK